MYKDDTLQIIDMSGLLVKVGSEFVADPNMYRALSNIFVDYFYFYNINNNIEREIVTTYDESN